MIQIEQKIIEIGKHIYLLDLLATVDSVVMFTFRRFRCDRVGAPFLYYPFLKKKMENRFSFVTNISIDLVIVSY